MSGRKLRVGDMIASSKSTKVFNVTDGTSRTLVMKMNFDDDAYQSEASAYERMRGVAGLRNRVPLCHRIGSELQCSIVMEKLDGNLLCDIIDTLSPVERADIHAKLTKTLRVLHHDAGVYHCRISPENIIVHEGVPKLLSFSSASLKQDIPEDEREHWANRDLVSLDGIFESVTSAKAYEEALRCIDRMRQDHDYCPEATLATLLTRIAYPSEELLDSISELIEQPSPDLALVLARHIAEQFDLSHAVHILLECSARFQTSTLDNQNNSVLEMKVNAARYTAEHKEMAEEEWNPSTRDLFNEAISFYLRSSPNPGPQRDEADDKVLELRLELATTLKYNNGDGDALEICEEALHKARSTGKKVKEAFVRDFQELLGQILKYFERKITRIEKDRLRGRELKSRPWSKQAEYEALQDRAEQALNVCDVLLLGQALEEQ